MTRTRATPLIGLGVLGLVLGFLIEFGSEAMGAALIIRAVTGRSKSRVDPFQALRVVALARASSRVGALLTGVTLGALLYFTTRPVLPGVGSMWLTIGSCVGAAILMAAGLLAEYLCTLPKDDDDDAPGATPAS
jgi:hypothetical protein